MADTLMSAGGWGKGPRSPGLPVRPQGRRLEGCARHLPVVGLLLPPPLRAVKPPCTLTVLDSEYLVE